jgi:hypothetical protein
MDTFRLVIVVVLCSAVIVVNIFMVGGLRAVISVILALALIAGNILKWQESRKNKPAITETAQ